MTWTSTGTSFWEATATVTGTSPAPAPFLPPLPPPPPPGAPEVDAPPFEQPYKNRSDTPITLRFRRTCRNLLCPVYAWAKCIDINGLVPLRAVIHILMLP